MVFGAGQCHVQQPQVFSLFSLAETLAGRMPFLLLGTGLEAAPLLELATELKAVSGYVLGERPGPFFPRLIQGILRRQEAP